MQQNQRRNKNFNTQSSLLKIFVYLKNNVILSLKWRKYTESKNPKIAGVNNGRIMLLSKYQCVLVKHQNLLKSKSLVDF